MARRPEREYQRRVLFGSDGPIWHTDTPPPPADWAHLPGEREHHWVPYPSSRRTETWCGKPLLTADATGWQQRPLGETCRQCADAWTAEQ